MPSMDTQELADLYESLQDLSDGVGDVDDTFDEVAGYVNGMRSAMAERDRLRELLRDARDHVRHPGYDWDVDFAREVDRALGEG